MVCHVLHCVHYDADMSAAEAIGQVLARGLSKSELSARSGVSRSLLDDYLKGRRQPSVTQLARLGQAAGLRLELGWAELPNPGTAGWARPNPAMAAAPLTMQQRAQVLERVVDIAMALRRRPRGELEFPPFRTLARQGASR